MIRSKFPYLQPSKSQAYCLLASLIATSASYADTVFTDGFEVSSDTCPDGRLLVSRLCYQYTFAGSACTTGLDDLTQFDNVWGRNTPRSTLTAFPGLNYYTLIAAGVGPDRYTAARFVVPTNLPDNQTGILTHAETLPGPDVTATISERCGDFSPPNSQCGPMENIGPGHIMAAWKMDGQMGSGCPLMPGQAYYLNVKISNAADCTAEACYVTLQNNHTP